MRFTAEHGHAILAGRKTTHRIPLTPRRYDVGALEIFQFPHVPTDSYQQPIRDHATGEPRRTLTRDERLRILSVTKQRLGLIEDNPVALKAEGYMTLEAFALDWLARHDSNTLNREMARRAINHQPPPPEHPEAYLSDPIATWRDRHARKSCLVVEFRVELADTVHNLAYQNGVVDAGNYTSRNGDRNIDREAEGLDPMYVEHGPTSLEAKQKAARDRAAAAAERADLPLSEQLARELADARANRRDTSSPEFIIRKQIERIRKLNQRAA